VTAQPAMGNRELPNLRLNGWIISACIHGFVLFLAASFVAQVKLAPSSAPFQWNVAVVTDAGTPVVTSGAIAPAQPTVKHSKPSTRREIPLPAPSTTTSSGSAERITSTQAMSEHPPTPIPSTEPAPVPPPRTDASRTEMAAISPPPPVAALETTKQTLDSSFHEQRTPPEPQATAPTQEQAALLPTPTVPTREPSPAQSESDRPAPLIVTTPSPTATAPPAGKPDYGWLAGSILQRIEPLKRYPAAARLEKQEGRVVVRAVILADGQLASSEIAKGSGHEILDQAALEAVRQAAPFTLARPLEKDRVTIHIPLSYTLGQ